MRNNNNYQEVEEDILMVNEPVAVYEKTAPEEVYIFNEWQQKRIDIALKQVENGQFMTEEEAEKDIQKWF